MYGHSDMLPCWPDPYEDMMTTLHLSLWHLQHLSIPLFISASLPCEKVNKITVHSEFEPSNHYIHCTLVKQNAFFLYHRQELETCFETAIKETKLFMACCSYDSSIISFVLCIKGSSPVQQHHSVVKRVLRSTTIQKSSQHLSSHARCPAHMAVPVYWIDVVSLVVAACTQQMGTTLQRCTDSPSSGLQSSEPSSTLQECYMFKQVLISCASTSAETSTLPWI